MVTLPAKLKDTSPTRKKRVRSDAHLKWVRSHRCCVPGCERVPIEAAHVRSGLPEGEQPGLGMKPGDNWTISLCSEHHRQQHEVGETSFEGWHGIDMRALAQEFAKRSPHRNKLR